MVARNVLIAIVAVVVAVVVIAAVAAVILLGPRGPTAVTNFRMSTDDTITNLDPALEYDLFSGTLVGNVFDTLYSTTPTNGTYSPQTIPMLAEGNATAVGGDTSLWQVKLKSGLKFSNGDPIVAYDVKFSIMRVENINDPESASFYFTQLMDRTKVGSLITCPDGDCNTTLSVRFQLNQSYSIFPNLLTFSTASVLNHKSFNNDFTKKITTVGIPDGAGSGPYKIDVANSDATSRITMVANPNYNFKNIWAAYTSAGAPSGPVPVTPTFTIFIKSGATALKLDIQTHDVNMVYRSLNPQDVNALKNDTTLVVRLGSSPQIRYFVLNVNKLPASDVRVRQAVAYMVNRQQIVDAIFPGGLAQTLWSMIPPGWAGHKDVFKTVYGTAPDQTKARQLLQAAGCTLPCPVELWYPTGHYGDTDIQVSQVLKTQLEQGGIFSVTLKSNVWSQYTKQFSRGELPFFMLGWFPDFADTDNYITPFLTPGGAQSLGSNYSNPVMTRLIANETGGPTAGRAENFSRIQDLTAQDVPYIPLWQTGAHAVYEKGVSGVILDPFLFRYYFIGKTTGAAATYTMIEMIATEMRAQVSRE